MKLLGTFIGVQLVVQLIGFTSGLLLVRLLSKHDYALFTIANSISGAMAVLSDSGVGSGLTAIGGRVWSDRLKLGELLATAMHLRRLMLVIVLLALSPVLCLLLTRNGATLPEIGSIGILTVVGVYLQLNVGILITIPRLLLQTTRIQRVDLISAVTRLFLLLLAAQLLLNVSVALLVASLAAAVQWLLLRSWTAESVDVTAPENADMRREILGIVRTQAPNSIYYCVQSQVMVLVLSVLGSSQGVAEVGALGRLGMIFAILGSIVSSIVVPRYVRCQEVRRVGSLYLQIIGTLVVVLGVGTAIVCAFPKQMLILLGSKYAGLEHEAALMVASASMTSLLGTMVALNMARGWIMSPWVAIPSGIVTYAVLYSTLDVTTVGGVLTAGLIAAGVGCALNLQITLSRLRGGFSNS